MEALIEQIPFYVKGAALILSSLVLFATAIARITKTKKDDVAVGKFREIVFKIIKFLPTIGINPETKKIEENLKELKEKDAQVVKPS